MTQSSSAEQVVVVVGRPSGRMFASVPMRSSMPSMRSFERADALDLAAQLARVDVVAEAVRGGVVGDGDVLEPEVAGGERHLLGVLRPSEASVWQCRSPRRSPELDQRGQRRRPLELQLAAVLAQLGRDPRQAEQRVDLLLGRAAMGLARRVVEDAVLGDVQAAADDRLAQGHVVVLRAGQVLQTLPNWSGSTTRRSMLRPVCVRAARRVVSVPAACSTSPISPSAASSAGGLDAVATMSMSLTESTSAARSRRARRGRRRGARAAPRRPSRRPRGPC